MPPVAPPLEIPAAASDSPDVSVCICTYRRPRQLRELLGDLAVQESPPSIAEVVVVDNDAEGSARATVDAAMAQGLPFPVVYDVQPVKNISLTRNKAIALARSGWIAMIDDDERPVPGWLRHAYACVRDHGVDGVLAPVVCEVPGDAPEWVRRGDFHALPRFPTGTPVPRNLYRSGNAFVRAATLRSIEGPFDPAYGLTGGEDSRMFNLLVNRGARFVWCDEAVVTEAVTPERLKTKWLLMRAFRGGNDHARHVLSGAYGAVRPWTAPMLALRASAQMLVAGALSVLAWPLGRHRHVHWLRKAWANAGKLAAMANRHHREYG